ncbi:ARM repeat-containing protein [Flagelloscypha sp. PMI_526]|nr:ARM repeat-containing protein [Flagelloscypha sp. PMI_526]
MSTSLHEVLSNTLSSDATTRKTAEIELTRAIDNPDAGLAFVQVLLSQDADISIRQAAGTSLRRFVAANWSPHYATFKGPKATPVEIKAQIRPALFGGLSDPKKQIRSLCASVVSHISSADWPDEYPSLLNDLLALVTNGNPDSVNGAMEVFVEFVQSDLAEEQLLPVLRDLLPILLNILGSADQYSPLTRSRTIFVFRQCVSALHMVKGEHAQAVKEATTTILPVWLEAFKVLLAIDPQNDVRGDNWDGLRVRREIFTALGEIYSTFPRILAPFLNDFLTFSLHHTQALFPAFERHYLLSRDQPPNSPEDGYQSSIIVFLGSVLDFLGQTARTGKGRAWFTDTNFDSLVATLFACSQITQEEEEEWMADANAFAAQEEELMQGVSMRLVAFDVYSSLLLLEPTKTVQIMASNFAKVIQSSDEARTSGNAQWWRPLEAAMASIGSQASSIQETIEDERDANRPSPIDIEHILTNVIPTVLNLTDYPFLQGRGFIFVSQFAKLLPIQSAGLYLEAAVQAIESPIAATPVKVAAIRAVQNFTKDGSDEIIRPYAERIVKDLGPYLSSISDDSLLLVLETLSLVIENDDASWISVELASSLTSAILDVYTRTKKADPMTISVMVDLFENLSGARSSGVYEAVVSKALPVLTEAITNCQPSEYWVASTSVELVDSLAQGAPESGLGEGFFAMAAPALFKRVGETEDRDTIQNIVICLTTMLRKDTAQILSWSSEGRSGLEHIFAILAKLLSGEDESGGLNMGDLIIHLLRKAGDSVLPVLPDLLKAMVGRMLKAQTATFLQSLLIPFAFLINNQRDAMLDLLESTVLDGRSGLDIFIQTFCENAETFQGDWPRRQCIFALTQLYSAASAGRASLLNMTVKGDLIIKPETKNVIMTRGRAKQNPPQFTQVTFPVKALKLLLKELDNANEAALIGSIQETTGDDDEEEDWDDEEAFSTNQAENDFLSNLLGPRGLPHDNDEILDENNIGLFGTREDEDLRQDPIMQVDLDAHVKSFFIEAGAKDQFRRDVEQLNVEEMAAVQSILSGH